MKVAVDRSGSTLDLAFEEREGLEAFVRETGERQAFLVKLGEELPLRQPWTVSLAAPGAAFSFTAEVVQRFDSVSGEIGTAFEVREWDEERLGRALAGEPDRRDDAATAREGAPAPPAVDTSETLGVSPSLRIRELDVNRRSILAMKAGRAERGILLRDRSPQVLQAMLSNPRLEAKEVLQLVKSTHSTAAILQRVAGDGRWGKNQEILTAVARNPKTPSPLAVRLMEKLRTQDLRVMAKMASGLRENVRRAALKEYLKRTQRR